MFKWQIGALKIVTGNPIFYSGLCFLLIMAIMRPYWVIFEVKVFKDPLIFLRNCFPTTVPICKYHPEGDEALLKVHNWANGFLG